MDCRGHITKATIQRCHEATAGRCCAAVHHATGRHIEPPTLPLRPQDGGPSDSVEQGLGRRRAGLRHSLHLLPRGGIGRPAHLVVGHQGLVDLGLGKDDGVQPGAEPRQQVGRLGRLDEVAPHRAGSVGRRRRDRHRPGPAPSATGRGRLGRGGIELGRLALFHVLLLPDRPAFLRQSLDGPLRIGPGGAHDAVHRIRHREQIDLVPVVHPIGVQGSQVAGLVQGGPKAEPGGLQAGIVALDVGTVQAGKGGPLGLEWVGTAATAASNAATRTPIITTAHADAATSAFDIGPAATAHAAADVTAMPMAAGTGTGPPPTCGTSGTCGRRRRSALGRRRRRAGRRRCR
mmetsp:Transcript_24501/g.70642  ORF Transcript_24501/g.70642 Transcript_24501/m.70642 type:complete len:346 (+) Transcript_24501:161-1198(+)